MTALAAAGLLGVSAPVSASLVGGPALVSGYDAVFSVNDLRNLSVNDLRNRAAGTVIMLPAPPGAESAVRSLTLFDAVQQANALPTGSRILITVADYVWVPNQIGSAWVSPSDATTPAGSWQVGSTTSPLLVKVLQADDPGFATSVGGTAATDMLRGAAWTASMGGNTNDFDSTVWGSRYYISHDQVTLDFQNRLGFFISGDVAPPGSIFAIGGDNITIRNMSTLSAGESGIIISAFSDGTVIENSFLGNPSVPVGGVASSTYAIERAIEIFEGASNTLIRNTTFDRNYVAAVNLQRGTVRSTVSNLTLDRVTWKQTPSAYTDMLRNYLVATGATNAGTAANTTNLTIQNSTINDWCADAAGGNLGVIDLEDSTHTGAVISGNTFNGSVNCATNAVKLVGLGTGSSFDIRNNTFRSSVALSTNYTHAWVYVYDVAEPRATNTTSIRVHDNTFSGGRNSAQIALDPKPLSRVLSVYRNTMHDIGGTPTAAAENGNQVANPIYTFNANGQVRTAFPAATPAPTVGGCTLTVNVVSPFYGTGGNMPTGDTLWVDVYAGDTNTDLDSYVGRIVANAATLQAAGATGQQYTLPYTGPAGYVRMQTMVADSNSGSLVIGQTSNISRSVQFAGTDTCPPQLWVKQGGWFNSAGTITTAQSDPTSNRFISFDINASEVINAGQLTAADITFSGTAPNQQVVSLTQVSSTLWQLVAKADGAGTVVPVIAAGAIADPAGNLQTQAANTTTVPINFAGYTDAPQTVGIAGASIDRSVTYVAPLVLTKSTATVTEAKTAPVSDSYGIGYLDDRATTALITDANGRILTAPTQPLQVCLSNGTSTITADPAISPAAPAKTIAASATVQCAAMQTTDSTGTATVTVVDNLVVDGSRTADAAGSNAPTFVVQSSDGQFDGLILGPTSGFATSLTVNDNDQPVASGSTLALKADGAQADGVHTNSVVATVRNADGDAISNAPVVFDLPSGVTWAGADGAPGTGDDVAGGPNITATIATNAAGQAVLAVTSTAPAAYPIHARVNGTQEIQSSSQTVTFVGVSVDLANRGSGFTVTPGTVIADGSATHTITVTLQTVMGTPAVGWAGDLAATSSPGTGVTVGSFSATATAGRYTATVRSTVSGVKTIAVTLNDGTVRTVPIISEGQATASFVAGPPVVGPGLSSVTIDDSSDRLADGIAFHRITTVLKDAQGNPVTGAAGQLTSSVAGSPASVSVTAFVESSTVPGRYTALVRSTSSGGKDVTVAFGGAATIGTATANFAAGAVDLGNPGSNYSVSTGDQRVGTGSHTVTVTLVDVSGNPVPGQAAALFATSTGSLGSGTITGFTETATAGIYTATVTSTSSGSKVITVRFGEAAVTLSGTGTASFIPAEADLGNASSNYSVSRGNVTAGEGQHAVTVRLADRFGNPVTGQGSRLSAETTDDLGTGAIGEFAETAAPGTYRALVSSSVLGGKTITSALDGDPVTLEGNAVASFVGASVDVNAIGTRYTVSTGDQVVGTGTHVITVTLSDSLGNAVSGQEADLESTTTAPLGTGSITAFTETGTPGTYTATITSSISGGKQIVMTFGADHLLVLLDGNDTASFAPADADLGADASGFFVSLGSVPAGTGQHTITVQLEDTLGNPVPGRAGELVATPSVGLGAGAITAFTEETPGSYTATITSTVAGATTISVTLSGDTVLADGNSIATFAAGGADLSAPGSSYSVSGGSASAMDGRHEITVTLTDSLGNPVAGQAPLLQGTTPDPLGGGAIGNFIEGLTGTYTAPVTSTVAGDKRISVNLSGAPVTLDGNGIASFTLGGVDVGNDKTRYSTSIGDQTVGTGSHTVTVTLSDAAGNPVGGQEAFLTATTTDDLGAGSISDFSRTATLGTYTATVTATVAGGKTIVVLYGAEQDTARADAAILLDGNGVATFVAGAADLSAPGTAFFVSTGNQVVPGAHTVTVTLADEYGNPVSGQEARLRAETSEGLGTGVITGFVTSGAAGTYTATVTSTVSGDKAVRVMLDGNAVIPSKNATASFVAGTVDPGNPGTAYSVSGGAVQVVTGSHLVTVTLADEFGNPVLGQESALTAATADALGSGSISDFTETGKPGTYEATVRSSNTGSKTITVDFGGVAVTTNGNTVAVFAAGGVDPSDSATGFSVSTGTQPVGAGSHTITVTLADAESNPVSGQDAVPSATVVGIGSGRVSAFTETATPGTYTATVTSTLAGDKTVSVQLGADQLTASGNTVASFVAGAVDPGGRGTGFSVTTGTQAVGTGSHTVTVTLTDQYGNPVSGAAGDLAALGDLGSGTISGFTETGVPGTYTATVTSTSAGSKPIAVTAGDSPLTASGNAAAAFVSGPVDPSASQLTATSPVNADGVSASTITLRLFDSFGNPATQQVPVRFSSTLGTVGAISFDGAGAYTAPLTSTDAGDAIVSATVSGDPVTQTAAAVFTDVSAPQPPVMDPSDGNTVTGCAEPGSTIEVRDSAGNLIGTAVAGPDCRFVVTLEPPQAPGSQITVTGTGPDGTVSDGATIRVGLIWMELSGRALERGAMQRATGREFQPGETATAVLHSTPIMLGSAVADANGDVVFTFQIPTGVELGRHSVTLTGDFSGTVSEDFTVVASSGLAGTGSVFAFPLLVGAIAALLGGLVALICSRTRLGRPMSEGKEVSEQ